MKIFNSKDVNELVVFGFRTMCFKAIPQAMLVGIESTLQAA